MKWKPIDPKKFYNSTASIATVYSGNAAKRKHRQRLLKEEKIKKRNNRPPKNYDEFWD